MTPDTVFAEVESPQFAAELAFSSGARFFDALESSAPFVSLQEIAKVDPSVVVARLEKVVAQPSDEQYANPYDAALASYVWSLRTDVLALFRALRAIRTAERVWWTRLVARRLEASAFGVVDRHTSNVARVGNFVARMKKSASSNSKLSPVWSFAAAASIALVVGVEAHGSETVKRDAARSQQGAPAKQPAPTVRVTAQWDTPPV